MTKISYTAVVLDKKSLGILAQKFAKFNPVGWNWVPHHMTITLGELEPELREKLIGTTQTLNIVALGKNDMAMAVKVSGCYSTNAIPHITLSVNQAEGGKPSMSNKIETWDELPDITKNIKLTGVVMEIPYEPINENKKMTESISDIRNLPFLTDVAQAGGKIYQVGGAVRDKYIGKVSKDLDIVITGIPQENLKAILSKYGKADLVGDSFGVIKFTPPGGEEIDIAIPRTEKKIGAGYKGFDVNADHTLPIETDLERRDFTMNSIAKNLNGKILDPYKGIEDIKNKIIRLTNPVAFSEDPLRMLRAVQFAARFRFTIEPNTFKMIQENAHKIKEIPMERILTELNKIVEKGNPVIGAQLLITTGLFEHIFGNKFIGNLKPFGFVKKMSELIFWLVQGFTPKPSEFYKKMMKGDIPTTAEIKALEVVMSNPVRTELQDKWAVFEVNRIAPSMLTSYFIMNELDNVIYDFKEKYPISYKELAVNGNDLIALGFKDQLIGINLKKAMDAVYSDTIPNNKEAILKYITNTLNENVIMTKDTLIESITEQTVHFFDFDGTLMNSPLPEEGKLIYKQVTGKEYPHLGWWGRPESLDMDVFDIGTKLHVETIYRKVMSSPNDHAVLLTNRQLKLGGLVKKILDSHNMTFEHYSYKSDNDEKGDRILKIMKQYYPNVKNIVFYDDDQKHLDNAEMVLAGTEYKLRTAKISSDLDYLTQNDEITRSIN